MGIVALGARENTPNQPEAILVTELGAAVLRSTGHTPAGHDEPVQSALGVLPTFELHLLQTDLYAVFDLLPIAEVEQIDQTSQFRLTHRSIQRALNGGLSGSPAAAPTKRK